MLDMKKSKEKAVDAAVMKVAPSYAEDMGWKADDALRTIMRAEEHKGDKNLMKEVKKKAEKMHKAVVGCK
jgi:4-hydroxyphenylpyruvate dioxygenase-like putative hemolysin